MHMEMNFEEALLELEGIVEKLETGQLSLDESLQLFEKGIKLVKVCDKKLKSADLKVGKLIEENGELRSEPLDLGEG